MRRDGQTTVSCKSKQATDENEGNLPSTWWGWGGPWTEAELTCRHSCLSRWRSPGGCSRGTHFYSVWVADIILLSWRRASWGWGTPPPTICATKKYTEGCPWHPQNYWAYCTAEMKTSVHNLNCFKQTSKQTIQPLVTLGGLECSPRERVPLLTWMDIACSDLLLVFAAGKLGAFEPLLYSHVAFLNPASTQFGAFRPGRPGAHPAAWKHEKTLLGQQTLHSRKQLSALVSCLGSYPQCLVELHNG